MELAKVTSKGQVTIPLSIRKKLGIKDGDKLLFVDKPEGIFMVNPTMIALEKTVLLPFPHIPLKKDLSKAQRGAEVR